jgi:hypothetical protein
MLVLVPVAAMMCPSSNLTLPLLPPTLHRIGCARS